MSGLNIWKTVLQVYLHPNHTFVCPGRLNLGLTILRYVPRRFLLHQQRFFLAGHVCGYYYWTHCTWLFVNIKEHWPLQTIQWLELPWMWSGCILEPQPLTWQPSFSVCPNKAAWRFSLINVQSCVVITAKVYSISIILHNNTRASKAEQLVRRGNWKWHDTHTQDTNTPGLCLVWANRS